MHVYIYVTVYIWVYAYLHNFLLIDHSFTFKRKFGKCIKVKVKEMIH